MIEINDTLSEWFRSIVAHHGVQRGPIVSTVNLRKRLRTVREEAKVTWIQDGMRHTYASNWLAVHKDEHRLRDNLASGAPMSFGSTITRPSRGGRPRSFGKFCHLKRRRSLRFEGREKAGLPRIVFTTFGIFRQHLRYAWRRA